MAFSGALVSTPRLSSAHCIVLTIQQTQTLTDLNDYITPSQACIKPVEIKNAPAGEGSAGAASVM